MSRSVRKPESKDRPDYDRKIIDAFDGALNNLSRYGFRV